MKRFMMLVLALCVGIAFATTGFCQAKDSAPASDKPAAAVDKPAETGEEKGAGPAKEKQTEPPKPKPVSGFVGKVVSMEGTLVGVKGAKDSVTFDVTGAKFKGYKAASDIKVGDKVAMKYDKKAVLTVKKLGGTKVVKEKKAGKMEEKKNEKPAEEKK